MEELVMKIVGVLQNPWFKPGTSPHHIELYQTNYEFRKRVLAQSHTGVMLIVGLGELWTKIYWTECSFVHGDVSGHKSKADLDFIEKEIEGADVVIAFGVIAREALRRLTLGGEAKLMHNFKYFESPHPACRLKKSYLNAIAEIKQELERLGA